VFRFFKMPGNGTEIHAEPASPAQSPPASAAQPNYAGEDTLLDSLTSLSKINSVSVVQHGARIAVIGELLVSVLSHLPATMRADIVMSFRDRIEEVMSLSDDRGLPQQYHSALLNEINLYLNALQ